MTVDALAALEPACTSAEALAFYDGLDPLLAEHLTGRWRGRELATGHPLDGRLAASGWYGKQFDDVDHVHPLLFSTPDGEIFPVDPRRVPLGLVDKIPPAVVSRGREALGVLRPALRTSKHRARLREVRHRGVVTAAMVYDHLPIIDVFRRVDDSTVLGMMDLRGVPQPYFFILQRD
ncbi:DUF4334 domain-containing protein [Nocardioides sp. CER19]|uniref:DUF4334 domain-containing protein n=1 Tax=Nocardioides sp. CER19 TaxID=3038538 RepID=UPI0024479293|nr:DUF4334 domain-containing protein [Nocardioides sp. CER19]MDH2413606.1 DUF4334 domain-containing protein [Nocardioides sp. CER19]